MTGIEVAAVGLLGGWVVQKAKRAAGKADAEVDRVLASAMDGLHELVGDTLGVENSALRELTAEAEGTGAKGAPDGATGRAAAGGAGGVVVHGGVTVRADGGVAAMNMNVENLTL